MFSMKLSVVASALLVLSLVLTGGCKSGQQHPQASAVYAALPTKSEGIATNIPAAHKPSTPPDSGDTMAPNILAWDSVSKEYHARAGEMIAPFSFFLTNVFAGPVVIFATETSCDCTVAKLPSTPWTIPSGGSGQIDATIDLSNKIDKVVTNHIIVFTSQGNRRLSVKAILPDTK